MVRDGRCAPNNRCIRPFGANESACYGEGIGEGLGSPGSVLGAGVALVPGEALGDALIDGVGVGAPDPQYVVGAIVPPHDAPYGCQYEA